MSLATDLACGDQILPIWQEYDDNWKQDFFDGLLTNSK